MEQILRAGFLLNKHLRGTAAQTLGLERLDLERPSVGPCRDRFRDVSGRRLALFLRCRRIGLGRQLDFQPLILALLDQPQIGDTAAA